MKKYLIALNILFFATGSSFSQSNEVGAGISLLFDGNAGSYVDLGDVYNTVTFPFLFEAWIKPADYTSGAIISTDNDANAENGIRIMLNTSGNLQLEFGNGLGNGSAFKRGYITIASIPLDSWTHIAVSCKSVTDVTIYINGLSQSFIATDGTSSSVTISHSAARATIGKIVSPSGTVSYKGEMDEIRLWKKSRSQFQIRNNVCVKYVTPSTDMLGYWTADESYSSNILADKAAAPEDGIINGNVTRVTSGAALGNEAKIKFTNNWFEVKVTLLSPSGDKMLTQDITGEGIFVYRIDAPPVVASGLGNHPAYYYGVYCVKGNGPAGYNVRYKYSGNNGVTVPSNELQIRFMGRKDDTDSPWNDLDGIIDTATNWITKHDGNSLRGEYTFDIPNPEKTAGKSLKSHNTGLSLFPNPAAQQIQLELSGALSTIKSVSIWNAAGKMVSEINHPQLPSLSINVSGYDNGTYFVNVITTTGKVTGKFTVQH
ncbi:MAG: T9SS type A sorting domain-containing protein [Chitinophagales bacterium]|nr:T9SS type A sorting domain-containing protein [Chitinophagales bacterium]